MSPIDSDDQQDLEHLISAEQDPKVRMLLVLLNRISNAIIENTRSIDSVDYRLKIHMTAYTSFVEKELALINRIRGAWYIIVIVIGALHLLAVRVWDNYHESLADMRTELRAAQSLMAKDQLEMLKNEAQHAALVARINNIEVRKEDRREVQ